MKEQINRKSPHSTGLRPLSGPLPKKAGKKEKKEKKEIRARKKEKERMKGGEG